MRRIVNDCNASSTSTTGLETRIKIPAHDTVRTISPQFVVKRHVGSCVDALTFGPGMVEVRFFWRRFLARLSEVRGHDAVVIYKQCGNGIINKTFRMHMLGEWEEKGVRTKL